MPYKDPAKKSEYQREYMRSRRAGESKPSGKTLDPEAIKTAKGLLDTLADLITEVKTAKADPLIGARCLGYLISIALKTVEVADLEERINRLEESTKIEH